MLVAHSPLHNVLLKELYASPFSWHLGFSKTYDRVKRNFFWTGMKKAIKIFIAEWDTCQCHKRETAKILGTLHPLLIPSAIWKEISMDFIEGLPKSSGNLIIFVAVDHLSKYIHFFFLEHPYTTPTVSQVFLDHIFLLHGMPTSIICDRDPTFTSNFLEGSL